LQVDFAIANLPVWRRLVRRHVAEIVVEDVAFTRDEFDARRFQIRLRGRGLSECRRGGKNEAEKSQASWGNKITHISALLRLQTNMAAVSRVILDARGGMKSMRTLGLLILCAAAASAADCDRACLKNTMTTYLNALVAQDPSKAPLAANVRFTEDSKDL